MRNPATRGTVVTPSRRHGIHDIHDLHDIHGLPGLPGPSQWCVVVEPPPPLAAAAAAAPAMPMPITTPVGTPRMVPGAAMAEPVADPPTALTLIAASSLNVPGGMDDAGTATPSEVLLAMLAVWPAVKTSVPALLVAETAPASTFRYTA